MSSLVIREAIPSARIPWRDVDGASPFLVPFVSALFAAALLLLVYANLPSVHGANTRHTSAQRAELTRSEHPSQYRQHVLAIFRLAHL